MKKPLGISQENTKAGSSKRIKQERQGKLLDCLGADTDQAEIHGNPAISHPTDLKMGA